MRFPRHRLSADTFAALAAGGGGAAAARQLAAAQYSKHVLLVWGVMEAARAAGHPQAGHACRGYELLAGIQRREPGAVEAVLRHPAVGGWAGRTLRALDASGRAFARSGPDHPARDHLSRYGGAPGRLGPRDSLADNEPARLALGATVPRGEPAQLAALAAAAAIRAGHPCAIEVPVRRGAITLPSVGQAVLPSGWAPDGMANVACTPDGTRVIAGRHLIEIPPDASDDGPGWRGLRSIRASAGPLTVRLVIDDLDPYRMPSAAALGDRLSALEAARWQAVLRGAWDLLASHPTAAATEIQVAIRVLTPLRQPAEGQLSASSQEVFGCVALSPPADGRSLAVTLVHEVQHAKLAAILDLVPLTEPDDGPRYYAPWRDDPRPLSGLLQGAYAYLGVSGFWRWQRHQETGAAAIQAHAEFARWRDASTAAAEALLSSGKLTGAGITFVTGMLGTLRTWADEAVPADALLRALQDRDRHLALWQQRNGGISQAGV